MRKLKLFSLALMALFSTGLWADTYYIVCNKAKVPLTAGMSGASVQLLKLEGTTLSATTDISITKTGTEGFYYNSTTATYSSFTTTSNYSTGSSSNRTMSGFKLTANNSQNITLKLGSSIPFSKLDVIYACSGTAEAQLTIAGTNYTTKTKDVQKATITSGLTGDVVISNSSDKDYYVFAILTAPSTYTLTFNANGQGTAPTAIANLKKDSVIPAINKPADPTATGYTFGGWYGNSACTGDAWTWGTSAVTKDTTLYAKWTANTYTVTLNENGGTINSGNVTSYTYGVGATLPSDVTQDNKDFMGWYVDNNVWSDGPYTSIANDATGNKVFYAKWQDAAPEHDITYTNTKGATNTNPATYKQGIGIAEFAPLADVAGWHFTEWSPASISDEATTDQTIEAQWLPINSVTFTVGAGSGTAPEALAKWEGQKFNLPGQGSMTAPAGKAFDGWKAGGTKYAAGAEYTMGNASVEFVAQWKGTPTTIFEWTKGDGAQITADNTNLNGNSMGTLTTGTSVVARKLGSNNIDNNSAGYKLGNDDVCLEIQGTSAFIEGDTVIITGKNGGSGDRCFTVAPSSATSAASSDTVQTNTVGSQTDNSVYKVVIKEAQAGTKMRVFRLTGKTMYCKSIKVRRPAQKDIISSDTTLTAVTIAGESLALSNFSEAEPDSFVYIMDGEYVTPPTIVYTKHIVITYEDDSQLVKDINITPEVIDDPDMPEYFWASMITIGDEQYVINIAKKASYDAIYMNGSDTLGVQHIDATGSPTEEYLTFLNNKLKLATIAGWYTNSGLTDPIDPTTYVQANPSNPVNVTFYAKITYNHASSVNIEQLVLDYGTSYDLMSTLGTRNYATNWTNDLDTLNDLEDKSNRNYAFLGQKVKAAGKMIDFRLAADSYVKVKFGNVPDNVKVVINGKDSTVAKANLANPFEYTASEETYMSIRSTSGSTLVFKQIMINEAIANVDLPAPGAYLVNLNTPSNGKIAANWADKKYRAPVGATVTLTATPDEGYKIATITLDGESLTVTDNVASFVMPSKDVSVVATFVDVATAIDNTIEETKAVKVLENGMLIIEKNGVRYNVTGQVIK